jgi:hypothetical protein
MAAKSSCFFILSCARSGSTSLATILNEAKNSYCAIEPLPNLNVETREMMDGRIKDPYSVINKSILPRVQSNLKKIEIYGEKNVTYGPFVPYIRELLKCKFIFLKRDGRDVVSSLINWHEQMFGTVYRECKELGNLSSDAIKNAAGLPVHMDTSDYSRPRPAVSDSLYKKWENLSRAEMCAYYWSIVNEIYLTNLSLLPDDSWIEIDYSNVDSKAIMEIANFCNLKGLGLDRIQKLLDKRINSLEQRGFKKGTYPDWKNWGSSQREKFEKIARSAMLELGYFRDDYTKWKPMDYGEWWNIYDGGIEWYTWMYNTRIKIHREMLAWIKSREEEGDTIETICDFGCGMSVGYCDEFKEKKYIGVDISAKNIEWCRKNRNNKLHQYLCLDFVSDSLPEPVDLVFSSGTLDNVYDIDACLKNMVKNSRKWIYVTFYRGWFPDLKEHKYLYDDKHKCFYNDASHIKILETLQSIGCQDIQISPIATESSEIPYETLVIARTSTK